ncbi:hypothetical protein IV203_027904 [Nitzschia inconspicua]|uniref:Uncharacterized protein n=1 Tax=Nitzschia inconspicua TaxID=303405 RepID=A0A9K3LY52_9STRA|nr:hypothetical protein IV203_027904 [Nitzschia inconspicua]
MRLLWTLFVSTPSTKKEPSPVSVATCLPLSLPAVPANPFSATTKRSPDFETGKHTRTITFVARCWPSLSNRDRRFFVPAPHEPLHQAKTCVYLPPCVYGGTAYADFIPT